MDSLTLSMNKQKYSNNISIKNGLRSKKATTKCSIRKANKQVNNQQQHCKRLVYIYNDFAKAKDILLQVHSF